MGEWGSEAQLIRVPGACEGRLQLQKLSLIEVGSHPAKLRTRAKQPLIVTHTPRYPADHVLRVSADWYYAKNQWADTSKRPAHAFRAWALRRGVKAHAIILDTWNFQQQGAHRIGDVESARRLFHQSGISGGPGRQRFFCDVLGAKSNVSNVSKVCWFPWKETETHDEYLTRAWGSKRNCYEDQKKTINSTKKKLL